MGDDEAGRQQRVLLRVLFVAHVHACSQPGMEMEKSSIKNNGNVNVCLVTFINKLKKTQYLHGKDEGK